MLAIMFGAAPAEAATCISVPCESCESTNWKE